MKSEKALHMFALVGVLLSANAAIAADLPSRKSVAPPLAAFSRSPGKRKLKPAMAELNE
jgi:hypothetical protein